MTTYKDKTGNPHADGMAQQEINKPAVMFEEGDYSNLKGKMQSTAPAYRNAKPTPRTPGGY